MSRVRSAVATLDTATMALGDLTSLALEDTEHEARSSADVQPTAKSFRFGGIVDSVTDLYCNCNQIVMRPNTCDEQSQFPWIRLITKGGIVLLTSEVRGVCVRTCLHDLPFATLQVSNCTRNRDP